MKNQNNSVELLDVKFLDFDKKNPRFPESIASGPTDKLLEKFIKDERLLEIVDSIGNHDFFHGEPLLVVEETKKNARIKKYKVVEGNRRLAALKLLNREISPPSGRLSIIDSINEAVYRPEKVPCIIFDDEDSVMRYLGFRHITGVKAWGALQKARYAKRLWDHYKSEDVEVGLKKLAKEIGSKSDYVGQMLTSLKLYEIAEGENFFGLDINSSDIEFSVLTTALSYKNILNYLGLDSRSDISAEAIKLNELKNIFDWLFYAKEHVKPVIPDSRDLKKLAVILASPQATKELELNRQVNEAYELSKGPESALTDSLRLINRRIDSSQKLAMKTPEITVEHKEVSAEIVNKATYLNHIIAMPKISPKKKTK